MLGTGRGEEEEGAGKVRGDRGRRRRKMWVLLGFIHDVDAWQEENATAMLGSTADHAAS